VLIPPFELARRAGGARSVMHAYTDIDGIPSAADEALLTGLLRDTWGFDGTVVADYFGIAFLKMLHRVAGTWTDAAAAALSAGVDVELPTVKTFGPALVEAVESGNIAESLVDRALVRVLTQKLQLGLLDSDWSAEPDALRTGQPIDLDSASNRVIARELADRAIVLLSNDGTLPLRAPQRIAVIGPNANTPLAVLGCYSFPAHVGVLHPEVPIGIELPTLLDAVRAEFPHARVDYALGTSVDGGETDFTEAMRAAAEADVVVLALGDRAGLFGRGTSGEGCDASSLRLPGAQQELTDALLAVGTPLVVTLLSGRPYALGAARTDAAAIVQSFFPGEEGTAAIAAVLSGQVNPSGRLPVSVPIAEGAQPSTYLAPPLAQASDVSNLDPTAAFAFGHGLGYSTITWSDFTVQATDVATDGTLSAALTLTNTSDRAGADVVQVYLHDPVASVVRPVQRLVGFARVELDAGESARVRIDVPADLAQFTGRDGRRVVEPGAIELRFARSSAEPVFTAKYDLTGPPRYIDHSRALTSTSTIA
jgi:beta-xylosidase